MLATHRAHINGLDTTHTAIILELNAGEIAESIGYRKRVKRLKFRAFKSLRNDNIFV